MRGSRADLEIQDLQAAMELRSHSSCTSPLQALVESIRRHPWPTTSPMALEEATPASSPPHCIKNIFGGRCIQSQDLRISHEYFSESWAFVSSISFCWHRPDQALYVGSLTSTFRRPNSYVQYHADRFFLRQGARTKLASKQPSSWMDFTRCPASFEYEPDEVVAGTLENTRMQDNTKTPRLMATGACRS
ncbi:uncharacterized protein LOC123395747 [Hordeum vulgare subsp. vulgare]|uniref:uncharacterized protein LOC123395747 n=1 Tax=Hordeum vulgare subsp. vulgare TaxID=112509 RepID=UPI00162B2136|nr:uncharacterized protein LOC123395747 [Hordeum vulgare subsp. vulgare]